MANDVAEFLPQYKGKLRVTGRVRRYYYNGRFIDDFEVQDIYAVKSDEKSSLALKMEPAAANNSSHDKAH